MMGTFSHCKTFCEGQKTTVQSFLLGSCLAFLILATVNEVLPSSWVCEHIGTILIGAFGFFYIK